MVLAPASESERAARTEARITAAYEERGSDEKINRRLLNIAPSTSVTRSRKGCERSVGAQGLCFRTIVPRLLGRHSHCPIRGLNDSNQGVKRWE